MPRPEPGHRRAHPLPEDRYWLARRVPARPRSGLISPPARSAREQLAGDAAPSNLSRPLGSASSMCSSFLCLITYPRLVDCCCGGSATVRRVSDAGLARPNHLTERLVSDQHTDAAVLEDVLVPRRRESRVELHGHCAQRGRGGHRLHESHRATRSPRSTSSAHSPSARRFDRSCTYRQDQSRRSWETGARSGAIRARRLGHEPDPVVTRDFHHFRRPCRSARPLRSPPERHRGAHRGVVRRARSFDRVRRGLWSADHLHEREDPAR